MLWCILYIHDFEKLKSQFLVVIFLKLKINIPQANYFWADFDRIWQFWANSVGMASVCPTMYLTQYS
jgi:hypothetical protein